jgi:CRP-like cAMP-binding protein
MYSRVDTAKGEELFLPGESSPAFFRVEQGLMQVIASDERGEEATLELVGPGGTIGELSLVARLDTPHTAVALTAASLIRVDASLSLAAQQRLLPAVFAVVAARVRVQQDAAVRGAHRHVLPRLASLLLDLAVLSPGSGGSVPWIPAELTQADLARVLASSRESVSRGLNELERRGWITRTAGRLLITSHNALRTLADPGRNASAREALLHNAMQRQANLATLLGVDAVSHGVRAPDHVCNRRLSA